MERGNGAYEAYSTIHENRLLREQKREEALTEAMNNKNQLFDTILNCRSNRERALKEHSILVEGARDNALSTVLKAIYITALEANTLTDDGILLAESMVDNWIAEKGGATKILKECENRTYLLARISQIVQEAADDDVKEVEKEVESDPDNDSSESKEDKASEDQEEKEDKTSEDKDDDDKDDNKDKEKEDKTDDPLNTDFEDDDSEDDDEDDSEKVPVDPEDTGNKDIDSVDLDGIDNPATDEEAPEDDNEVEISIDGEAENNGKVFDELEKEEDIKKAIELIRQRVADAEETFIKRNAEDKKKIDELLGKISDNIKTVEDMDEDSSESKVAQESARMQRRKISSITENRPLSILEKMTRNLTASITKDEVIREHYATEDGNIDIGSVVESAKVMYGFLETLNTLQLEKVNEEYISKVLSEM